MPAASRAPGLTAIEPDPTTRRDRRELAAIFAGGALGTLARAGLAEALPRAAGAWPWSTFIVNVVSVLLLGFFVTRLGDRTLSRYRRPFLATGVCGGLSTFSTMQVEVVRMFDVGAFGMAAAYLAASVAAGLLGIRLATAAARRLRLRG